MLSFAATNIAFPEGDPISLNIAAFNYIARIFYQRIYWLGHSKLLAVPASDKDVLS